MSAIVITDARIADLDAVMRVMAAAFDPAYGEAWTQAQMLTLFGFPGSRLSVARLHGRLCGFAAQRCAGPESELLLLAVEPDARGHGIGRALMSDWLEWARTQDCCDAFLEMRADNPARQLYSQMGFSEAGRRPEYYCGADGKMRDAITMRHAL